MAERLYEGFVRKDRAVSLGHSAVVLADNSILLPYDEACALYDAGFIGALDREFHERRNVEKAKAPDETPSRPRSRRPKAAV